MKKNKYDKPLKNYSPLLPLFILPFAKESKAASHSFLKTIMNNFFKLQKNRKEGKTNTPILFIEHQLDEKIPFVPAQVSIYMDFASFFLRIFSLLIKELGFKKGISYCAALVNFLEDLYIQAAKIYRFCMTTTERPKYKGSFKFLLIHFFDPHLLCVPSLHVAIVTGVCRFMENTVKILPISEDKKNFINEQIFYGAWKITQSVLLVKQHSINCVAAALYMNTMIHEDGFFTEEDAKRFIDKLFMESDEIDFQTGEKIREYIFMLYKKFVSENLDPYEWQNSIYSWLITYAKQTGQTEVESLISKAYNGEES